MHTKRRDGGAQGPPPPPHPPHDSVLFVIADALTEQSAVSFCDYFLYTNILLVSIKPLDALIRNQSCGLMLLPQAELLLSVIFSGCHQWAVAQSWCGSGLDFTSPSPSPSSIFVLSFHSLLISHLSASHSFSCSFFFFLLQVIHLSGCALVCLNFCVYVQMSQ